MTGTTTFSFQKVGQILLLGFLLLFSVVITAQTTIWSEDFNSYANGTITGTGTGTSPVNWNSQAGAAVSGGLILASNTRNVAGSTLANPLVWVTDPIIINGYLNVTFSIDTGAFNVGNFEDSGGAQDNFTLDYRIDGGAWTTVVNASGSAAQPINPSYTISGLIGSTLEIRARFHNTAGNENYTIDNVLVQGTPATADSDGDGVPDQSDLDNDNDGIPDTAELNTVASNSQPPCGGETVLDFSAAAVLISGTALTQGAVYRISNITAGTDALVTIVQTFNATVANIDNNTADPASFKPQTAFNFPNVGDQGYIEYKIQFVASAGFAPVIINRFFMNFNDIDGGANYGEQNWANNPATYTTSNPTELTMSTDGSWVIGTAGPNDYPGAGNTFPQVNFSVNYNSKSEMSIRVGAVARVPGASSGGRQHAIEFACITNYVNPVTYGIDTDSDGVANHLDLDADNDGIYDAVEAGHNRAHVNGVVISSYGLNGLADLVETAPESGALNYVIADTDGNPPPNYLDTDSDDDGCSDANEAYADANADGGDDEYYGVGSPPPVDVQGRVSAAAYTVPADIGPNGTLDYLEAESPPVITIQPADTTVCPGCNTSLTVAATAADTYQWQQFIGAVWVDMTDTGIYSGTTTNTLVLTNVTTAENGTQYRAVLTNLSYVCGNSTTNTATVTVNVSTVITNKRITYRVNKN